jgi:hypothetical protein
MRVYFSVDEKLLQMKSNNNPQWMTERTDQTVAMSSPSALDRLGEWADVLGGGIPRLSDEAQAKSDAAYIRFCKKEGLPCGQGQGGLRAKVKDADGNVLKDKDGNERYVYQFGCKNLEQINDAEAYAHAVAVKSPLVSVLPDPDECFMDEPIESGLEPISPFSTDYDSLYA